MMRSARFIHKNLKKMGAFVFTTTALLSSSVFAADPSHVVEHGAEHLKVAAHAVGSHGGGHQEVDGLPQLDFTTYPSQIFWLFTAFIILYLFFSKKTLPEISSTIEGRREHIQGDLDNADRLKKEAEDVHNAYEDALAGARTKASEQFKKTEVKIKANANNKLEEFKARSEEATGETEKLLEKAKADAIGDMQNIAAEVASIAAEKIIGVPSSIDNAKTVVKNINKKAA